MKLATIVGARPQFIKAATVSRLLRADRAFVEVLIHTGQHYDPEMSDVFFTELTILKPDYNLGIGPGLHGAQTGRMLQAIEEVLLVERPEWVLVDGDTNQPAPERWRLPRCTYRLRMSKPASVPSTGACPRKSTVS